jgi:hypothetical protein
MQVPMLKEILKEMAYRTVTLPAESWQNPILNVDDSHEALKSMIKVNREAKRNNYYKKGIALMMIFIGNPRALVIFILGNKLAHNTGNMVLLKLSIVILLQYVVFAGRLGILKVDAKQNLFEIYYKFAFNAFTHRHSTYPCILNRDILDSSPSCPSLNLQIWLKISGLLPSQYKAF